MNCVDASAAAKWFLNEESSDRALALLNADTDSQEPLVAPPLLTLELTNIFCKKIRTGGLPHAEAQEFLRQFQAFPVRLIDLGSLHADALQIAVLYGLPATYDAYYVALAQTLDAILWTADRRLLRTLAGRLPFVQAISDYPDRAP